MTPFVFLYQHIKALGEIFHVHYASEITFGQLILSAKMQADQSWFERKIDSGSADLYFHYYGTLQHQQNMLQDYIRTGGYYSAVQNNRPDFEGKVVMDVGAGSGMLSLFAAQVNAFYCSPILEVDHGSTDHSLDASLPQMLYVKF